MTKRFQAIIKGRVQGVGFRPTVWRYATELGLAGFVCNTPRGVLIEIEGPPSRIDTFFQRLRTAPPRQARIESVETAEIAVSGDFDFRIIPSERSGDIEAGMPPDLATCDECRDDIFTPSNRRYRYAFTNCTNCGPRFTIIRALPYDRARTSMAGFKMCSECQAEYDNPADRRFDAQPNACPVCGPRLRLVDSGMRTVEGDPIGRAAALLREGAILAVKGLGGYHLCCDATSDEVVRKLRLRKNRPAKSLAVMFQSLDEIGQHCVVSKTAADLLSSPAMPIVVLPLKKDAILSPLVSPDTRDIGAFLPYTPLHHLLLAEIHPLIMTSGNLSEEPIAKNEDELQAILGKIADYALTHNRPIVRRCDDSVVKVALGGPVFLRRSRGYVPEPIELPVDGPPVLACGGELKNTFCVTRGPKAFLSQHIGDLTDFSSYRFFKEAIADLLDLLNIEPACVAHDLHPDYLSTRYAKKQTGTQLVAVQHHHAHMAACMAEHGLTEPVIGVIFDGTGYGPDGTVWGGEFLVGDLRDFRRVAHLKQYRLPGADGAIRHPERMALSCLCEEFGDEAETIAVKLMPHMSAAERRTAFQMIDKGIRSPWTSSAGRLFDAIAALLGLVQGAISYEGQAAIRLQTCAQESDCAQAYPWVVEEKEIVQLTPCPLLRQLVADRIEKRRPAHDIASMFHNGLATAIVQACEIIRTRERINKVVLSGGVFQNDLLLERVCLRLTSAGFQVFRHVAVPPNDAGIALGQAAIALARSNHESKREHTTTGAEIRVPCYASQNR